MKQQNLLCALAACAALALPATATAQTKPPCSFAFYVIDRNSAVSFAVYIEATAVDCKNRDDAYQSAQAAFETAKKSLALNRNPLKDHCYKMPSMQEVDCKAMTPTAANPFK